QGKSDDCMQFRHFQSKHMRGRATGTFKLNSGATHQPQVHRTLAAGLDFRARHILGRGTVTIGT
ncbi:MAG: hypothetical protein ACYC36_01700, partial [Bellilinea sp.]